MRHVVALLCLLLVAVAPAGAAQTAPSLRILETYPRLIVRGSAFAPRSHVRVTLRYEDTRRTRLAQATQRGWFVVVLGPLPGFDPCRNTFRVVANGRGNERAQVEFTPGECPN